MNIKSKISKLVSGLLCFSMIFSNVLPAYAADAVITENTLDGEDLSVNERNLEDITVTYKQTSSFFVTIPKTIVLDGWKQSTYSVKVSGDIDAEQCVYVAPVDGIADTENIDFYMKDQASENAKDDVVANVTHNKFHWNSAEVAAGHKQADNLVEAPDLTAGAWRGIFQMEIKLETHVTHKHNYVETISKEPTCTETGEKTYTCDCGDSYTEEISATGHKDTDGDGVCDECGENDPNHKHSYTETITKEPTCTEAGEKTYTCGCGESYTEEIPAKGHNYVDGVCDGCGDLNLKSTTIFSVRSSNIAGTENGSGHYDRSSLAGTYSENIEITEDMIAGEYLLLDFCVRPPYMSGQGRYDLIKSVSGSAMLQKYDDATDTWSNVYSYPISSSTIGSAMQNQEGGYNYAAYCGITKHFKLEKGTYRVYGTFSSSVACASRTSHYFCWYSVTADLCQIDKGETVETP